MKKKILIISIVVVLLGAAVTVFAILNSKNSLVGNLPEEINNGEQITENDNSIENEVIDKTKSEDYTEVPEYKNISYCENEKCALGLFMNCKRGTDDYFDTNNKKWSFVVNNKGDTVCNVSVIEYLENNNIKSVYCMVPLEEISQETFEKIINIETRKTLEYCN